jgi:hypothetical protein
MPPMLEIERGMSTIKQLDKRDNVCKKPPDITQLSKNSCLINVIKKKN